MTQVKNPTISKYRIRNGQVKMVFYMPLTEYERIARHALPEHGDKWESPLMRRIVREWKPRSK